MTRSASPSNFALGRPFVRFVKMAIFFKPIGDQQAGCFRCAELCGEGRAQLPHPPNLAFGYPFLCFNNRRPYVSRAGNLPASRERCANLRAQPIPLKCGILLSIYSLRRDRGRFFSGPVISERAAGDARSDALRDALTFPDLKLPFGCSILRFSNQRSVVYRIGGQHASCRRCAK